MNLTSLYTWRFFSSLLNTHCAFCWTRQHFLLPSLELWHYLVLPLSACCHPCLWQEIAPKVASFLLYFCVWDRTSLCWSAMPFYCMLVLHFILQSYLCILFSFILYIKKKNYDLVSSLLLWQNHSDMIQSSMGEESVCFCFQVTAHHCRKSKSGTCSGNHGGTAWSFEGWCLYSLDSDAQGTVPHTGLGPSIPINNQDNLPQTWPWTNPM